MQIRKRVIGQPPRDRCVQIVDVEVGQALTHAAERDRVSIRRPRGIQHFVNTGNLYIAETRALFSVEHRQCATAVDDRRHRELPARAVPCAGGVNELQARVVGLGGRARQFVQNSAAHGIGNIEIDCQ